MARVTAEQSLVSVDINVMSDKELRATKKMRPHSEVPPGQWKTKKVSKELAPKVTTQTSSQKRREQKARAVQKFRGML